MMGWGWRITNTKSGIVDELVDGLTSRQTSNIHLLHAVRKRMDAVPRGLTTHRIIRHALVSNGRICRSFWSRRSHL